MFMYSKTRKIRSSSRQMAFKSTTFGCFNSFSSVISRTLNLVQLLSENFLKNCTWSVECPRPRPRAGSSSLRLWSRLACVALDTQRHTCPRQSFHACHNSSDRSMPPFVSSFLWFFKFSKSSQITQKLTIVNGQFAAFVSHVQVCVCGA